jgi:hypothetical protein
MRSPTVLEPEGYGIVVAGALMLSPRLAASSIQRLGSKDFQ